MANPNKVGLVLAALVGGWHLLWSLLILLRLAQSIIDFLGAYDSACLCDQTV